MSKGANKSGKVYLVGAGPGDLGLVTLCAKECIENADVIIYDHLANPDMLSWARDNAEIIYVGKEPGESRRDRKSTRLNSSHRTISYAVFCLKKKNQATGGIFSVRREIRLGAVTGSGSTTAPIDITSRRGPDALVRSCRVSWACR